MPSLRPAAAALSALLVAALSPPAEAGEAQLEVGLAAAGSTWRGDAGGGPTLRLGYRFARVVAVDFMGWEHYASVNRRLNTGLTLGVTGFLPLAAFRPLLRLYAIHQHEEALVSIEDHPFGTVAGIGGGIRHRAGAGAALGAEVPLGRTAWGDFHAVFAASATWFPDATLGPAVYLAAGAALGLSYDIPGLP
jgi:hypothetical protein